MPIYEYRCDQHGVSEITRPLGEAPKSVPCLVCGGEAKRVFSVGMIRSGSRGALLAAMDHAEKSRHEPEVVTSLPSTGAKRKTPVVPLTPALRRLPRP
jgi:putative FmdB family regulatory protein